MQMRHLLEFRLFEGRTDFERWTNDPDGFAREVGDMLGIDWGVIELSQFVKGIGVEMREHGASHHDTDVIGGDPVKAAKIALAHLRELRDYYDRLDAMEKPNEALRAAFDRYESVVEGFSDRKSRVDGEYLRMKRNLPGLALTLMDGPDSYLVKLGQADVVQYFKEPGIMNVFGMNIAKVTADDVTATMNTVLGRSITGPQKNLLMKGILRLARAFGVRPGK